MNCDCCGQVLTMYVKKQSRWSTAAWHWHLLPTQCQLSTICTWSSHNTISARTMILFRKRLRPFPSINNDNIQILSNAFTVNNSLWLLSWLSLVLFTNQLNSCSISWFPCSLAFWGVRQPELVTNESWPQIASKRSSIRKKAALATLADHCWSLW